MGNWLAECLSLEDYNTEWWLLSINARFHRRVNTTDRTFTLPLTTSNPVLTVGWVQKYFRSFSCISRAWLGVGPKSYVSLYFPCATDHRAHELIQPNRQCGVAGRRGDWSLPVSMPQANSFLLTVAHATPEQTESKHKLHYIESKQPLPKTQPMIGGLQQSGERGWNQPFCLPCQWIFAFPRVGESGKQGRSMILSWIEFIIHTIVSFSASFLTIPNTKFDFFYYHSMLTCPLQ